MEDGRKLSWLVTAGPTAEDIDPVRFITNRSSGRMGYAVARAAAERGDAVTLVSGPVSLDPPGGCEVVRVRSAREMCEATLARAADADVVVMAAAVADFRPKRRSDVKIAKGRHGEGLTIELERTEDILLELGRRRGLRGAESTAQVLVGFALETPGGRASGAGPAAPARTAGGTQPASGFAASWATEGMRLRARAKLESKNLDVIALNGPSAFAGDRSALAVLVRKAGEASLEDWGEETKDAHARRLVDLAAKLALSR